MSEKACPFKAGDVVVYQPSDRNGGLLLNSRFEALVPGARYKVAFITKGAYVTIEGFERVAGGGLYWTNFSRPDE